MTTKPLRALFAGLYAELGKMNKEQLEGASFSLFTLYDSLHPKWLATGSALNDLALHELFSNLANICSKLHTVTRRHKSSNWIEGAITVMEKIREHIRDASGCGYVLIDFMHILEDAIDSLDGLLENSGA